MKTIHAFLVSACPQIFVVKAFIPLVVIILIAGCVGGPPHDYYNPAIVGAQFKKPITVEKVESAASVKNELIAKGMELIGSADYSGRLPQSVELITQAKRVGANHVVYSAKWQPAPPGSWGFSFGGGFGSGGSGGGNYGVHILFLGKPPVALP